MHWSAVPDSGRIPVTACRFPGEPMMSSDPLAAGTAVPFDPLTPEQMDRVRRGADEVLATVGLEVRDHAPTLERFAAAGARVEGTRITFEPGLARAIVQASAPRRFLQRAPNPARDVVFGDGRTVTAPAGGPPMVRTPGGVRRYGTLADFEEFAARVQASDAIDHAGGMYVEPTDVAPAIRHLRSMTATLRWSDKPLMGYGRDAEQVRDSLDFARLVFGDATFERECCLLTLLNIEAPLVLTGGTAEALWRVAAEGQGALVASYPVLGMTAPVDIGTALALMCAEVEAGAALTQLVRPGAPVMVGLCGAVFSMSAMRPIFGGSEAMWLMSAGAQIARDLGCPVRGDGAVTSSKVADAQAGADAARGLATAHAAGVDFALHSAGWLESGLVMSPDKFVLDTAAIRHVRQWTPAVAGDAEPGEPVLSASTDSDVASFVAEREARRLAEAAT